MSIVKSSDNYLFEIDTHIKKIYIALSCCKAKKRTMIEKFLIVEIQEKKNNALKAG